MQDLVPTDLKKFSKWLQPRSDIMPADLYAKGVRARCTLVTRDQKAWKQSGALRRLGKQDWQNFVTDPRLPDYAAAYLD